MKQRLPKKKREYSNKIINEIRDITIISALLVSAYTCLCTDPCYSSASPHSLSSASSFCSCPQALLDWLRTGLEKEKVI